MSKKHLMERWSRRSQRKPDIKLVSRTMFYATATSIGNSIDANGFSKTRPAIPGRRTIPVSSEAPRATA